jgi:hypothetical protein
MKTYKLIAFLAFFPIVCSADPYRYPREFKIASLQSAQGVSICVSAQNYESGYAGATQYDTAEHLQIMASGSTISVNSKIRAVITNQCVSEINHWPVAHKSLLTDLGAVFARNIFEFNGTFDGVVLLRSVIHGGDTVTCRPQLSVVVDDVWQTDPVNGTHNFNLLDL